jgi:hypothetical protein
MIRPTPDFVEQSFGRWEGLSWAESYLNAPLSDAEIMYLLYCDESNLEERSGIFFVYGGLAIHSDAALQISRKSTQ